MDAVEEKDLATRYGVTGFPTIKYFPAGDAEPETYSGGRDAKSFVEFLNTKVKGVGGRENSCFVCLRTVRAHVVAL